MTSSPITMADAIERLTAREAEHIAHLDSMIEDQAARFGWDAEQQDAERVVLDRTAAIAVNFRDFQTLLEAARQPPSQVPAEDVERVAMMRSAFMSGWLTRHSSGAQPEAAFQVYVEAQGLLTALQVTEGDKVEHGQKALEYYYSTTCPCVAFERYVEDCPKHGLRAALHPKQEGEG
jgi:biotin carboxyl carrier protein